MTIPQQDQNQNAPAYAEPAPRGRGYFRGQPPPTAPHPKSPAVACILSIIPGLGQIYVGFYGLGFLHAVVASALFAVLVSSEQNGPFPMLVIFFVFFMLYNIVDAGRRAALYNLAIAGVPGIELPQPVKMPRPGGTIFGGAVLIVGSFLLLMHTKFGFSLDWVQDWWPLAPMIFGGYLIARAVQDRAKAE